MPWEEYEANTLEEFVAAVDELLPESSTSKGTYWFRGQSNAEWKLVPSFMRISGDLEISPDEAVELESEALKAFQSRAHLYVSHPLLEKVKTIPCWWALMQHHLAPTRLLDWTTSPYVAAYFAAQQDGTNRNGAVWSFCSHQLIKTFEAANQGKPPDFSSEEAPDWYRRKLDELRDEKLLLPLSFPYVTTERMAAQQGHFTMCFKIHQVHDCIIEQVGRKYIRKIIIPYQRKSEFLLRLRDMNITAAALFPGIDGLGRSVNELVSLGGHYKAVV